MRTDSIELFAEYPVTVHNPNKLLWAKAGVTKLAYMQYLVDVAPALLRHLKDRPLTVIRYPHGVGGHSFFQKDAPAGTPEWVNTVGIWSPDRNDDVHYVLVDSLSTLLWLANLACLELHVGFTTWQKPDEPTAVAFDLDPTVPGFEPVREVALCLHDLLERLELPHVPKTSGATGLQVFIPLAPGHSFDQTRVLTKVVAQYLESKLPSLVTLERLTKNRGTKVYVDYPQHGHNRTLISAYSTRATEVASVSTPLTWEELRQGAVPPQFTVHNVPQRLRKLGDLMDCGPGAELATIVRFLSANPSVTL